MIPTAHAGQTQAVPATFTLSRESASAPPVIMMHMLALWWPPSSHPKRRLGRATKQHHKKNAVLTKVNSGILDAAHLIVRLHPLISLAAMAEAKHFTKPVQSVGGYGSAMSVRKTLFASTPQSTM